MAFGQHHQSPFRVAAIILSILCFLLSLTYWLRGIAGAIVVVIVLLTLVTHLDQWVLYAAIVGTIVAAVGSLVDFIRDSPESAFRGGLDSGVAMLTFFLWLLTGLFIYQIPVDVPVTTESQPAASDSSSPNTNDAV